MRSSQPFFDYEINAASSRLTSTFALALGQNQRGLLFPLARKQARLPSRGFLTWCDSGDLNLLFLWLLSFSVASSLAFSHLDLLLELIEFIRQKDLPARRSDPRIHLTLSQKPSGFHQRSRYFANSAIARLRQILRCIRLRIEDSHRDHQHQKQKWNNDGRHDPLGQAKLPHDNAPALRGRSARRSVTGVCHGKHGDHPTYADATGIASDKKRSAGIGVRGRRRLRFYSRRSRNRSLSLRNGCMLLAGRAGRRPRCERHRTVCRGDNAEDTQHPSVLIAILMRTPPGAQAPLDLIDAKAICWRDSELTPPR
jgi:hypothetical protein